VRLLLLAVALVEQLALQMTVQTVVLVVAQEVLPLLDIQAVQVIRLLQALHKVITALEIILHPHITVEVEVAQVVRHLLETHQTVALELQTQLLAHQ
jgi:hypothetical protein